MGKGFTFKQFHVDDHDCGMPVSTDGVLLGAWAQLHPQGMTVDIGTGSGLLALMAAQRYPEIDILALDIDPKATQAAQRNFQSSPWGNRLKSENHRFQLWSKEQPKGRIYNILCNPPYFNFGEQTELISRATARHTDQLSHHDLLVGVQRILHKDGKANFILPTYEGEQFIQQAQSVGLFCTRLCSVKSTEKKPVTRLLIELSHQPISQAQETLVIHQNGHYSSAFSALTQAFYLKL